MLNISNISKVIRIFKEYLKSIFIDRLIFFHITPTRKCNLRCGYCYQYDNNINEMSLDEFKDNIDNNYKLGLSIVSFTGGEPLVWKYLDEAIEYCTFKNIFTQLTTNGHLLTRQKLNRFKEAGLDYLMISLDGIKKKKYTQKTIFNNPDILNLLKYTRLKGIIISWNTVLTRDNYNDVYELIEISKKEKIPISISVITPPPNKKDNRWDADDLELSVIHNSDLLSKIVERLKQYKDNKYPIIEPKKYFEDINKYLNGEKIWNCNLAKKMTLQISPESKIYWCSKLNLTSQYKASSINKIQFVKFKEELADIINSCNHRCYSNCAYNAYYLQKHKSYFLINVLPIFNLHTYLQKNR